MISATDIFADLQAIRAEKPLVHNITNYVVMNWTANCLLALGASPVMAHAIEEIEDMVQAANALVVNIGTLNAPWVESMDIAMRTANELGKPIVFDPVGVGATKYRTETAQKLLGKHNIAVVRGNSSEILGVTGGPSTTHGVNSTVTPENSLAVARDYARRKDRTVCISGPSDYICSKDFLSVIRNGSPLMASVTGMGCAATAMIGAFLSVRKSAHAATSHAMALCGICGEIAATKSGGPGSFQGAFLDALYAVSLEDIGSRLKTE